MKASVTLLLPLLLVLIACPVRAQTGKSLNGFLDMPWGTPVQEAKPKMLERPGVTFKRQTPSGILFSGGSFAGRPTNTFGLYFSGGKLYRGDVCFNPAGDRNAVLQAVKKELTAKYGPPTKSGRQGFSRWSFPATASRPVAEALELALTQKHNEVRLSYINETMATAASGDKDNKDEL